MVVMAFCSRQYKPGFKAGLKKCVLLYLRILDKRSLSMSFGSPIIHGGATYPMVWIRNCYLFIIVLYNLNFVYSFEILISLVTPEKLQLGLGVKRSIHWVSRLVALQWLCFWSPNLNPCDYSMGIFNLAFMLTAEGPI